MTLGSVRRGFSQDQLRSALVDAIKDQWDSEDAWPEKLHVSFTSAAAQSAWNRADADERGKWLLSRLRRDSTKAPGWVSFINAIPVGSTFAELSKALLTDLHKAERERYRRRAGRRGRRVEPKFKKTRGARPTPS